MIDQSRQLKISGAEKITDKVIEEGKFSIEVQKSEGFQA